VKILLDTHALLWWLTDDGRLGRQARELVEDSGNDVLISMVSLWEIAVKTRVGKLEADIRQITDAVQQDGFALLDIRVAHLLTLVGLPLHHRDPFDHLLIAQAITEDATFMSEDHNIAEYPVRSLTCSGTTSPSPPGAR
jgi:PIN domain nuclease of toxin-antitoxin system